VTRAAPSGWRARPLELGPKAIKVETFSGWGTRLANAVLAGDGEPARRDAAVEEAALSS